MRKSRNFFDTFKLYKGVIITFAVLTLLGPIAIYFMYPSNPDKVLIYAPWNAADLLGYYGVIITLISAVYALIITIKNQHRELYYNKKSSENDSRMEYCRNQIIQMIYIIDVTRIFEFDFTNDRYQDSIRAIAQWMVQLASLDRIDYLFSKEEREVISDEIKEIKEYSTILRLSVKNLYNLFCEISKYEYNQTANQLIQKLETDSAHNEQEIAEIESTEEKLNYSTRESIHKSIGMLKMEIANISDNAPNENMLNKALPALERYYDDMLNEILPANHYK